jgi:hypothetical protein
LNTAGFQVSLSDCRLMIRRLCEAASHFAKSSIEMFNSAGRIVEYGSLVAETFRFVEQLCIRIEPEARVDRGPIRHNGSRITETDGVKAERDEQALGAELEERAPRSVFRSPCPACM